MRVQENNTHYDKFTMHTDQGFIKLWGQHGQATQLPPILGIVMYNKITIHATCNAENKNLISTHTDEYQAQGET
jgi:hypothetical protein